MELEQKLQKTSGDDDGCSAVAPSKRNMGRSSFLASLRDAISIGESIGETTNSDEDEFVFKDQIHQRKEFEMVNATLTELGFVTSTCDDDSDDGDEDKEVNEKELYPLLSQSTKNDKENKDNRETQEKATSPHSNERSYPYRRQSKIDAFQHGQKESFIQVLDRVDQIQDAARKDKGLNEWNFTFGLVNCLFIAYVHGSHPEHFWILYAVETIFWMSYKLKGMYYAQPLCEVLYYLDFCWVMNTLGAVLVISALIFDGYLSTDLISIELRKNIFLACFGIFCGPVFLAAMVLPFVAFLFHDVNTMANLIIHLMPSMVMYNQRWHAADIYAAYPTIFPHLVEFTEQINRDKDGVGVSRMTLIIYFAWFVPYTVWMLRTGLKLPAVSKDEKKPPPVYDTVFHSTWKGALCEIVGSMLWKRSKKRSRDCSERNDYEIRDFLFYMVMHAFGSCGFGIIVLGDIMCYRGGKVVHGTMLCLAIIICAKRGADRYTYYVTKMYGQKLRKVFHEGIEKGLKLQEPLHLGERGTIYGAIQEEDEGKTKEN